jgi:hypothetical protein
MHLESRSGRICLIVSNAWAVVVLFGASTAEACPLCHSETGQLVRSGIFDSNFGANLFAMLLPFLIIGGVVALIYRGTPSHGPSVNSEPSVRSRGKSNGR